MKIISKCLKVKLYLITAFIRNKSTCKLLPEINHSILQEIIMMGLEPLKLLSSQQYREQILKFQISPIILKLLESMTRLNQIKKMRKIKQLLFMKLVPLSMSLTVCKLHFSSMNRKTLMIQMRKLITKMLLKTINIKLKNF